MDLNAEVDNLVRASQAWIPMIMEYGSRVLLAVITLAIGWWLINKVTRKLGALLALRNADLALQGFISTLANVILKILLIVSVASMIGVKPLRSSPPSVPPAWRLAWPCRAAWRTSPAAC